MLLNLWKDERKVVIVAKSIGAAWIYAGMCRVGVMMASLQRAVAGWVFLAFIAGSASSQDLVYQPINPSFGGDPFNSAHLLGIANIDRPDPPASEDPFSDSFEDTQADFFVRQLESRILSRLSADITDAIFGPDADPSGTFAFDDTTIAFETLLDGTVLIQITDTVNGGTTEIEVPGFLADASN